jgi:hypothetical protein
MGISYKAGSLLTFVFAISLIAYFYGIYVGNEELVNAAKPFLIIFGLIWGIFIALAIYRNIKNL